MQKIRKNEMVDFNPRSREGSDDIQTINSVEDIISIHAPAKGATVMICAMFFFTINFNPRSREGSDLWAYLIRFPKPISIHAPAKGATVNPSSYFFAYHGFQSTLPRRERPALSFGTKNRQGHFNPRSREGSDTLPGPFAAPVADFNPRSREGSDNMRNLKRGYFKTFQSTLPRRERHLPRRAVLARRNFNPRSREGSDTFPLRWECLYTRFQSTLPRRERQRSRRKRGCSGRFQSTLPRRERQHLLTSFRLQYGYSLFHLTNKI